ncbi:carbohydrate ABC transporter permease [Aquipuribacter sp. MA13-13]|uniref:carbohydrate ABC transporter permease n=1 Tax=Aquipuribacter sp. MA13-13 TaxID=3440840 RepID=UPI003EEDA806
MSNEWRKRLEIAVLVVPAVALFVLFALVPPPPPPGPDRQGRRPMSNEWRKRLEIAVLVVPAVALFVLFALVPMGQAIYYSLFNWNGLGPVDDFVGIGNYQQALGDSVFRGAILNNFVIVVLSLAVQLPLGLGIALLLNRPLRGRTALRTMIFVPYVLAEVIAGVIWLLMLQPRGVVDSLLAGAGLDWARQLWLGDQDIALYTLFVVLTWKYVGFAIILFLAGLQGVPLELNEAAALDGASWWQIQRNITIPLLGPTIRIWAFLSMIGALQLFDMVWILTGGGPGNATQTMATYLIQQGFDRGRLGYGTAAAVILFVISLFVALLYQRFVLSVDNTDDSPKKRKAVR